MTSDVSILPKRPATTDDLAAHVAGAEGAQVLLQGSGSLPLTRLDPDRRIQPVSTLRMNALLEHAVSDMTVTAHAGMTLDQLQRHLAWHNQWVPLDPPAVNGRRPMARTLGGLIATNSLGPLRHLADYRLLILGARWVDAAGTVLKGGGRTMKNVAGYHTPRMLIGSCGTLGALAEVTLRTFARPADEQAVILYCPTAGQAEALIAEVLAGELEPAYIQLLGGRGFGQNLLELPAPPAGYQLAVIGFLGEPAVCAAQVARTRALPAAAALESLSQTAPQAGRLRLWMTSEPPCGLGFRLHTLSSHVAATIARLEDLAAQHETSIFLASEAAAGVIRGAMGDAASPRVAALAAALTDLAAALPSTSLLYTCGAPPARTVSEIESRLKHALDPAATFGA